MPRRNTTLSRDEGTMGDTVTLGRSTRAGSRSRCAKIGAWFESRRTCRRSAVVGVRRVPMSMRRVLRVAPFAPRALRPKSTGCISAMLLPHKDEVVAGFEVVVATHGLVGLPKLGHEAHHRATPCTTGRWGRGYWLFIPRLHPLERGVAVEHGPLPRPVDGNRLRAGRRRAPLGRFLGGDHVERFVPPDMLFSEPLAERSCRGCSQSVVTVEHSPAGGSL